MPEVSPVYRDNDKAEHATDSGGIVKVGKYLLF